MKKILLVDDDALVMELYRKKLVEGGFEVRTALDGVDAIKQLAGFPPDLVVLDLMMPRLSGADVLKFIRSTTALAKVPVAVMTNAFMSDHARAVTSMGVDRAIIKGECTPNKLLELARQLTSVAAVAPGPAATADTNLLYKEEREAFLKSVPAEFTDLKMISQEFAQDPAAAGRVGNLHEFCRQAHHLSGAAGLARYHHIALLSGALEALLFELGEKPQFINLSTTRTVTAAVEFLGTLIESVRSQQRVDISVGEVLAVDDDPLANRIVTAALNRAKLTARTTESPATALELLAQNRYDLVLLDVEMPGMNGFDLCRKLREMPGYENTPVIYVTTYADFDSRVKAVDVGGNDLIAKPVFPIELAVKALMHLIRAKLASSASAAA
jgi:DNA-binding response OmpR family regulator